MTCISSMFYSGVKKASSSDSAIFSRIEVKPAKCVKRAHKILKKTENCHYQRGVNCIAALQQETVGSVMVHRLA